MSLRVVVLSSILGCSVAQTGTWAPHAEPTHVVASALPRTPTSDVANAGQPAYASPVSAMAQTNHSQTIPQSVSFYPWIIVSPRGRIALARGHKAILVLVNGADQRTTAPGYTLDSAGLREAETLLSGLPASPQLPELAKHVTPTETKLAGEVTISGDWPVKAELFFNFFPGDGGPVGYEKYLWNGKGWRKTTSKPMFAAWDRPGNPPSSAVHFDNGSSLWERFQEDVDGVGTSTFYTDPKGHKPAARQRMKGPVACEGGTRLKGQFVGVALPDGGLLAIGPNCETGVAEAEYWEKGAIRSRILELPNRPIGPVKISHLAREGQFVVRSANDVTVGFTAANDDSSGSKPYVAHFDGLTFYDISPPFGGTLGEVRRSSNGALWAVPDASQPYHLWRCDDCRKASALWQDVTPRSLFDKDSRVFVPFEDSKGKAWLVGGDQVFKRDGQDWSRVLLHLPENDAPCSVEQWLFLDDSPVIAASCDDHAVLFLTTLPAELILR